MVYKRYIKRNGKTFGPYYYESYRDEEGKTRTKLVSAPKKNTLKGINKFSVKLIYILIIFSLFLTAVFVIFHQQGGWQENKNSEKTSNFNSSLIKDAPAKVSLGNSKIIGNIIKLIGFNVLDEPDSSAENTEQSSETENLPDENTKAQNEIAEENTEEPQEIVETPTEDSAEAIETETEINQTEENVGEFQNEVIGNQTETQISSEPVTAQENISSTNETLQNFSEINQTITENINLTINQSTENLTISETNQTIQGINFTINENIIQYSAKLGQPVKWKKTLKIDAGENKTINNLEITLPKTAGDVSVKKIFANESVEELEVSIKNEKIIGETEPIISITGQFVKNNKKTSIFKKIFKFFGNFVALVGRVIELSENNEEVLVNIQEELEDEDEIEIEYFTEAPYSEEIIFNDNYKKINIVGSEEIHYENILAFSNLSKEVSLKDKINLYWLKNDSRELIDFNTSDLNENGEIDYIEWIVPSLSNQTYEIILISKAEHLDSNKNFISDIYESVKALDGNWSEQINDSEYVRVTFEKNLTSEKDITIYPRTISPRDDSGEPNGTLRIEVYEGGENVTIAVFDNLINEQYNKVYLTNLVGEQNTFDLKILGGSLEFEHIIDPFTGPSSGNWMDLSANDTDNWAGTTNINNIARNINENLIYTGLDSGKFGVYNHSNGVWMDLSGNDTGNWVGTDHVYGIAVNTNNNLVYTSLNSGKFGVYNHSNGVWMDLSGNDTGNWAGTTPIISLSVNSNDNLVYTGFNSGKFGVYNHSNGVWMDLSGNDTGNWVGTDSLFGLSVNTNDNLVYTALDSGKFGVYNHSNGVWMDLSGNDTGNWVGTTYHNRVAVNTNNNLVYTGLGAGKFGVYNHSNGVLMDLSGNDTGNWVGTLDVFGLSVNTNNNLVYTGLDSGKFGVYNHSNGVWMDLSGNDTGNWVGTTTIIEVVINPNDNLVYTGLYSGKFGVYRSDTFSGGGAGTLASPYEISNCIQLQNMSLNLDANYELVNNIDCSDTINWNNGAGFSPVGLNIDPVFFSGSLHGNNYNITDLYIKNGTTNYVGLFGYAVNATINKVHLKNVYVEGGPGSLVPTVGVGGLVGAFDDNGTISNSSVHGNITSKGTVSYTGGLAGWIWDSGAAGTPTIYNSSFTGNISATGNSGIGGLVGWSDGIINYSFANVKLNSTNSAAIGGLVGTNALDGSEAGIIDNSYTLGNVSVAGGSSAAKIGGLVGENNGNIIHSYSAMNVSGNTAIGGLVGNNVRNLSQSYSCGNVKGTSKIGGLIGTTQSTSNTSFSYSANIVSISEGTSIGGFAGRDEGAGAAKFNFSFYDSEIDGGDYDDIGVTGNHSGIYANTTAQMKKQSTYTALGWDFTNVWQIAEDYSYPYFKWQTTPACGIPVPPIIVSGGGSGNSVEIIELMSGFRINPTTINVVLNKTESKTECFTVASTGTLSLTANLNVVGEISPFTTLTNSVLQIPVQNSKSACAIFSADEFDIPENYTGQIEVSAKEKKYIQVNLEIREINATINATTNITTGILPIGIMDIFGKFGFEGILPLGESFLPPGYDGILPVGTFPTGILPVEQHLPLISKAVVKGIVAVSLWILLLLFLIIYLTARRFVKLQDQLQGYKSREEKLAVVERIKRSSLRKEANIFERILDKGTIYLSEKALGKKAEQKPAEIIESKQIAEVQTEHKLISKPLPKKSETKLISSSLPAYATERYKRGAEFYSLKEYDKALKEFQKAVEVNNKFWQAYQGIGSCYLAKGDKENAKKAFEKSLLINPKNEKLAEWMKKYGMKK